MGYLPVEDYGTSCVWGEFFSAAGHFTALWCTDQQPNLKPIAALKRSDFENPVQERSRYSSLLAP